MTYADVVITKNIIYISSEYISRDSENARLSLQKDLGVQLKRLRIIDWGTWVDCIFVEKE